MVMFLHPECPCGSASVEELERILCLAPNAMRIHVLFEEYDSNPAGSTESALFVTASRLPGVRAAWDRDQREAEVFGARTSGHVVVFDADGLVTFRGGITGSRGHAGANRGRDAVVAIATGSPPPASVHPVFGCSLVSNDPASRARGPRNGDTSR